MVYTPVYTTLSGGANWKTASKRGDFGAETVLGCKFATKSAIFDAEVKLKCQTVPKNAISDAKIAWMVGVRDPHLGSSEKVGW